jgi:hypothetical protein
MRPGCCTFVLHCRRHVRFFENLYSIPPGDCLRGSPDSQLLRRRGAFTMEQTLVNLRLAVKGWDNNRNDTSNKRCKDSDKS